MSKMPIWGVQLRALEISPSDMWKCHINSSQHYGDIPLRRPWRQKMLNSPEESDLEDSLTHTSWTLLLIYITVLTKKPRPLLVELKFSGIYD